MKRESTLLFNTYDLDSVLLAQAKKIKELTSAVPPQTLLEKSVEELVQNIEKEIRVEPLDLLENDVSVDQEETKFDVSQDFMRHIIDRSRPFYIDGLRVSYYVPFKGNKELFRCKPNSFTFNPPYARVSANEVIFEYDRADRNMVATKQLFERDLGNVRQWIAWGKLQIDDFNSSLASKIQHELNARQQHLRAGQQQIGDLGFKVRPKKPDPVLETSQEATSQTAPHSRKSRRKVVPEYDIALSFAGEDRHYVEHVANKLREANVNVFYDKFEETNLWGKNLADHLGAVYSNSRYVVIFVSKYYADKVWPNHERQHAQARALRNQEDTILPARFDDTEVPGLPSTISYINLRKITPDELAEKIIRKVNQS